MGKLIGGIVLSILGVIGLAVPSAFAPPAMLRSPDVQMGVMVYTVAGGIFLIIGIVLIITHFMKKAKS